MLVYGCIKHTQLHVLNCGYLYTCNNANIRAACALYILLYMTMMCNPSRLEKEHVASLAMMVRLLEMVT